MSNKTVRKRDVSYRVQDHDGRNYNDVTGIVFPVALALACSSNLVLRQFYEQDADAALFKCFVKRTHTRTHTHRNTPAELVG